MHFLGIALSVVMALTLADSVDIFGQASVIDGDTIEIHDQRIRLHGIDAPESGQQCIRAGQRWPCGRRAAFALSDRIGNRTVRCNRRDIDRYGRVVAVCFAAGENLNAWLVRNGWALAYRRYSQAYVSDEDTARRSRSGIWAGSFIPPWDWRRGERLGAAVMGGTSSEPRSATRREGDQDCGDFSTWREAQTFFESAGPGDPHRLDRDKDGIACEGLR